MQKRLKVLFYGDTLVLAGLRSSLESYATLEVAGLDGLAATEQTLCALRPNVVIFDTAAVQPAFRYSLVEKLPNLLLVGVDSTANRVLLWSGRQLSEPSTGELVEVIGRQNPLVRYADVSRAG